MKLILKLVVLLAVCSAPLHVQSAQKGTEEVRFSVNMKCHNCQNKVEKNIPWEKGVKDLAVNLEEKTVLVTFDSKKTSVEKLKNAFEELGFECEVATDESVKSEPSFLSL